MKKVLVLVLLLVTGLAAHGGAEIPGLLNYQGVLTDAGGSAVPDGAYEVTFRIYNVLSGGSPLWEETQTAVQVTKGIFSVMLGSVMKLELPFDTGYYLGVSVEGEAELSPRVQLAAAPYSFSSKGVTGADNIFPSTGSVGIGVMTPYYPLTINGPADKQVGISFNGYNDIYASIYTNAVEPTARPAFGYCRGGLKAMTLYDTDDRFKIRVDGINHVAVTPTGEVGIGNMNPAEKLDVAGAVRIGTTESTNSGTIRWTGSDFEGFDGGAWQSLTGGGGASLPEGVFGQTLRHDGTGWHNTGNLYNDGLHIGIGTTSPDGDVDISGTGEMDLIVRTASPNGRSDLELRTDGGTSDNLLITKYSAGATGTTLGGALSVANLSQIQTGSLGGPLLFNNLTLSPIIFGTNNYERMRLDGNGNLGIRTSTPEAELHVGGGVRIGTDTYTGTLYVYRSANTNPLVALSTNTGGGRITLYHENGVSHTALIEDTNGDGGYLYVKRDPTYTAFRVDGNYNGTGDPVVSIFGSSATTTFNMGVSGNNSVNLPGDAISNAEILDETGVASFEEGALGVSLTTSPTISVVGSQSITVPANGYVLAIATCQAEMLHTNGTESSVQFGVSSNSSTWPANQDVMLRIQGDLPSGYYDFPVTCTGLFQVSAGTRNFYMIGMEYSGYCTAYDRQLSLVFIPTAYGTVEPTVAGPGVDTPGEPMTEAEIDAQRAASIEANMARMEAELAGLRAQLEALKVSDIEEE